MGTLWQLWPQLQPFRMRARADPLPQPALAQSTLMTSKMKHLTVFPP
jgi:hypothetical protein